MLKINGLVKRFGSHLALNKVDLEIKPGEITGLLGPNGAGKSTLASIVAGLLRPDAGEVWVGGTNALRYPARVKPWLGLAPQELGFYPTLSVYHNLLFFGELAGQNGKSLKSQVATLSAALGLEPLMDRKAGELSGGQKRRLHTALALLNRPQLLFLDEPTVGADVETRNQLLAVVRQYATEGCAICYCTHYLPEVEQLGATVAILEQGRIIARGPLKEIVQEYATSSLELVFRHKAPCQPGWYTEGNRALIATGDPLATAAEALANLGEHATALQDIKIVQPSLESAYIAITGRSLETLKGV